MPNIRHRRIADPGRLSPAPPVARLRDRPPGARMAPHRNREGLVLQTSRHLEGPPAEAALYRSGRVSHPVFPLEIAHCRKQDRHVCLCRSWERHHHRDAALGPVTRACLGWHTQARDAGSCGGHRTQLQGRKPGAVCFERLGAGSGGHQGRQLPGGGITEGAGHGLPGASTPSTPRFSRATGVSKKPPGATGN